MINKRSFLQKLMFVFFMFQLMPTSVSLTDKSYNSFAAGKPLPFR